MHDGEGVDLYAIVVVYQFFGVVRREYAVVDLMVGDHRPGAGYEALLALDVPRSGGLESATHGGDAELPGLARCSPHLKRGVACPTHGVKQRKQIANVVEVAVGDKQLVEP